MMLPFKYSSTHTAIPAFITLLSGILESDWSMTALKYKHTWPQNALTDQSDSSAPKRGVIKEVNSWKFHLNIISFDHFADVLYKKDCMGHLVSAPAPDKGRLLLLAWWVMAKTAIPKHSFSISWSSISLWVTRTGASPLRKSYWP